MISIGAAMFTTGIGCIINAYVGTPSVNSIQEDINGHDGFLKSTYQVVASELDMSEPIETLIYDLIDIGISIHGNLKLVFKADEFGRHIRKLWHFGLQDLVRHYSRMKS